MTTHAAYVHTDGRHCFTGANGDSVRYWSNPRQSGLDVCWYRHPENIDELTKIDMCQCGHTRASHGPRFECWGCTGGPCDAPGVTAKLNIYAETWRWNLRCERHGSLEVRGLIGDCEPSAVTLFRSEHAGHVR